jgi:hypothetical protein
MLDPSPDLWTLYFLVQLFVLSLFLSFSQMLSQLLRRELGGDESNPDEALMSSIRGNFDSLLKLKQKIFSKRRLVLSFFVALFLFVDYPNFVRFLSQRLCSQS